MSAAQDSFVLHDCIIQLDGKQNDAVMSALARESRLDFLLRQLDSDRDVGE